MIDEDFVESVDVDTPYQRVQVARMLARAYVAKAEALEGVHRRAAMRQARYVAKANECAELAIEAAQELASDHAPPSRLQGTASNA